MARTRESRFKIGMLKIQELRKYAETELGEKFSLQDFHDVVLQDGAMPMDILEDVVYSWVDNQ
ncbi:MAG: hypothetical protein Ct9H90mP15_09410 [Candidatus Neomarinimicrobiota bacterium]|nr:MAG: hypothetical protein Ct9H90mP15_09410 [Candidatus Neomarinimicrobiota bacterium]